MNKNYYDALDFLLNKIIDWYKKDNSANEDEFKVYMRSIYSELGAKYSMKSWEIVALHKELENEGFINDVENNILSLKAYTFMKNKGYRRKHCVENMKYYANLGNIIIVLVVAILGGVYSCEQITDTDGGKEILRQQILINNKVLQEYKRLDSLHQTKKP